MNKSVKSNFNLRVYRLFIKYFKAMPDQSVSKSPQFITQVISSWSRSRTCSSSVWMNHYRGFDTRALSFGNHAGIWWQLSNSMLRGHSEKECSPWKGLPSWEWFLDCYCCRFFTWCHRQVPDVRNCQEPRTRSPSMLAWRNYESIYVVGCQIWKNQKFVFQIWNWNAHPGLKLK